MQTILLIDDDSHLRTALRRALELGGYRVEEAANGRVGIEQLERHPVDLVVTDIIMPEMEGVETIIHLRRNRPDLPIIAMSGGARVHVGLCLKIAETAGAVRALAKPFGLSELLEAVEAVLKKTPARSRGEEPAGDNPSGAAVPPTSTPVF